MSRGGGHPAPGLHGRRPAPAGSSRTGGGANTARLARAKTAAGLNSTTCAGCGPGCAGSGCLRGVILVAVPADARCSETGCPGHVDDGLTACLAHLDSATRDAYLTEVRHGREFDARGARISAALFEQATEHLRRAQAGPATFIQKMLTQRYPPDSAGPGVFRFDGAVFDEEDHNTRLLLKRALLPRCVSGGVVVGVRVSRPAGGLGGRRAGAGVRGR